MLWSHDNPKQHPWTTSKRIRPFARDCHEIATNRGRPVRCNCSYSPAETNPQTFGSHKAARAWPIRPAPFGKAQVEPTPTQCDAGMLLLTMP